MSEEKKLLTKLKKGWTLHLWRNSSPHNMWLESPRGKSDYHLDSREDWQLFRDLKARCRLRSKEGTVQYAGMFGRMFRPKDEGLAMHEIWEFDPDKEASPSETQSI